MNTVYRTLPTRTIRFDPENPRVEVALEKYGSKLDDQRIRFALQTATEGLSTTSSYRSLKDSIRAARGISIPIVVWPDGDEFVCVDGNTRLAVYRELDDEGASENFCRPRILRWCEKANVGYVLGLPSNKRLAAQALHRLDGDKQRLFHDFKYAAGTWPRERRVVAKAEHTELGANTRFVDTWPGHGGRPAGTLRRPVLRARRNGERKKDQQLGLFADRASSSAFHANQFRLLLSALAFVLLEGMRRMALSATDLARASPQTIRLTLLKVGAVVMSNTRRVRLPMSRSHPDQALFRRVAAALAPQPP